MCELQREFQDRCEQIACLTSQLCQADENLKQEMLVILDFIGR